MTLTIRCVIFRHFRNKFLRERTSNEENVWAFPAHDQWWSEHEETQYHRKSKSKLHLTLCRVRSSSLFTDFCEHNIGAPAQSALRSFLPLCSLETSEPTSRTAGIVGVVSPYQTMPPAPKSAPPVYNAAQQQSAMPALHSTDGAAPAQAAHRGEPSPLQQQPAPTAGLPRTPTPA